MKLIRALLLSVALIEASPTLAAEIRPLPVPPARVDLRQQAANSLLKYPVYEVMSRRFPDVYATMLDRISEGMSKGNTIRELIVEIRPIYLDLLGREAAKADAENTRAMMILARDQANAALEHSPEACMVVLGLAKGPQLAMDVLPEKLAMQDLVIAAKLFEQTATRPAPPVKPLAEGVMENLGGKVVDRLPTKDDRKAFFAIGGDFSKAQSPAEKRAACLFMTGMVEILLEMPGDQGTEIYRNITSPH